MSDDEYEYEYFDFVDEFLTSTHKDLDRMLSMIEQKDDDEKYEDIYDIEEQFVSYWYNKNAASAAMLLEERNEYNLITLIDDSAEKKSFMHNYSNDDLVNIFNGVADPQILFEYQATLKAFAFVYKYIGQYSHPLTEAYAEIKNNMPEDMFKSLFHLKAIEASLRCEPPHKSEVVLAYKEKERRSRDNEEYLKTWISFFTDEPGKPKKEGMVLKFSIAGSRKKISAKKDKPAKVIKMADKDFRFE